MIIRPAKKDDFKDHPVLSNVTLRAYVAEDQGSIVGYAGYLYEENILQGFSWKGDIKPLSVIRLAKKTIELFKKAHAPIYSIPSIEHEGSRKFLDYLGFVELDNNIFVWDQANGRD